MTIPEAQAGKTITWTIAAPPSHGQLSGLDNASVTAQKGAVTPTGITYQPQKGFAGIDEFTVQVSDGDKKANTTITVFVTEAPDAGTITGNVVSTTSIQMTNATGAPGGVWSTSDNNVATIDQNGLVTALGHGVVTISYTVETGCGQRAATTTYVAQTREIGSGELLVFPNPNKGTFRINFHASVSGNVRLTATDVTGRTVYTQSLTATEGINSVKVELPDNARHTGVLRIVLSGSASQTYNAATVVITE
jgi:hypothetical protein